MCGASQIPQELANSEAEEDREEDGEDGEDNLKESHQVT